MLPKFHAFLAGGNKIGGGQCHREQSEKLNPVGDVPLGVHQQITRQADNPLIWSTTSRRWQFGSGNIGDVDTNDSKITAFKFPNVRASATADTLSAIGVRVLTNPAEKFNGSIHVEYDNRGSVGKMQE